MPREPVVHDMTDGRRGWGHNLEMWRQDQATGRMRGFIFDTPVPRVGDEVRWTTPSGEVVGVIREIDPHGTRGVDDMVLVTDCEVVARAGVACRECGCTDVRACVKAGEEPCHWVERDLCSACS